MSQITEVLVKPLLVGVSGYLGAMLVGAEEDATLLGSINVSLPMFSGLVSVGRSLGGEVLKNYALPYIPGNSGRSANTQGMLIAPLFNGIVSGLTLYALEGTGQSFKEGAIVGAGSELAGSYAYSVLAPYVQ